MSGVFHSIWYAFWLVGELSKACWTVVADVLTGSKKVDPCVVYYPLRVTKDWQITAFAASITITPGTMSLELVDDQPSAGHAPDVPRLLAVHAVHGSDPRGVLADLAAMEETMAPHVKGIDNRLDEARVLYPAPKPVLKEEK